MRFLLPVLVVWNSMVFFAGAQADYKRFFDEDKLPVVRELFLGGRYSIVIRNCDYAMLRNQPSYEWRSLKMRSLAAIGRYEEALREADSLVRIHGSNLGALLDAHKLYSQTGLEDKAVAVLEQINNAARDFPKSDRSSMDRVLLGKAALALGADPSTVLERYFNPAKRVEIKGTKAPPGLVEAHQAAGDLALDKSDFKMAADEFRAALKYEPNHPEIRLGLARAYLPDDRKTGMGEVEKILEEFPYHFGALLIQAEFAINYERYGEARSFLDLIHGINPLHGEAWGLRAVLAELEKNDDAEFARAREKALAVWRTNPGIDHLIGRVLSRNYRFQEGANSQRRALEMDPDFLPAKLQLALDYLRLGQVEMAWPLAREVAAEDQYNVLAYNLEILEEEMNSFATIETDHFVIRLPANEKAIYGERALSLLEEARTILVPKYGVELPGPTLVEFFPNQADFAIRSFGSLGGAGLLGVCFGSVVTMNSPGSLTHNKNNWEATLWHEYAHVITLTATKNRMPRWLSEGISVYEEMEKRSNWGQRMTPEYRKMILEGDELTPISEMSSAFFNAQSGAHLMFAYYQSMLVVRYMVDEFGIDSLKGILTDLADGILINDAISRNTTEMATLEEGFRKYALGLARDLAPGVDWTTPEPTEVNPRSRLAVALFVRRNPKNFWGHQTLTRLLLSENKWFDAVKAADDLISLYPEFVDGVHNGYIMKARAYRGVGDSENEAAVLRQLSEMSAEAYQAYNYLLSLDMKFRNWNGVLANADRAMAIDPFLKDIHYGRGCACQELGRPEEAIDAFEKLLKLSPQNPSEIRYRLASLYTTGDPELAKRYILDSLADSPRYRDAYRLFLELDRPVN